MLDIIVVAVCLYFAYNNIRLLAQAPLAQWHLSQYFLALVTLGLIVVGVWKAIRVVNAFINAQKRARAEADKMQGQAGEEGAGEAVSDGEDEEDAQKDEGGAPDGED